MLQTIIKRCEALLFATMAKIIRVHFLTGGSCVVCTHLRNQPKA